MSGVIELRFQLSGQLGKLRIPSLCEPARKDQLWQHTCFEAFIADDGATDYREFNFSPSSEWAAYRFSHYRQGMAPEEAIQPEGLRVLRTDRELTFETRLPLRPAGALRLALAAVIESESGTLSYWALRHPAERPDFHHPGSFAITLP